jgi:transporter family-2 protein
MIFLYLAGAFLVGAVISVQTGSNTQLKEALEEPLTAIIVSSSIGVLLLIAFAAALRVPAPSVPKLAGAPWSALLGGLCGAIYAVTVVLLARELGAATLTALVLTGQLVCSVVLDHFALLGFEWHQLGLGRLIGCLLLVMGTAMIWRF